MNTVAFQKYLEENTTLQPSSILKYVSEARRFCTIHTKLNTDVLNKHILKQSKFFHNNRTKYALKYYLKWIGHEADYALVHKVKSPPKKKLQIWHELNVVKKVIKSMPEGTYRDFAILQIAVGARAREVLTIREENIDLDIMRVMIVGKGNKTGYFYYPLEFLQIFKKYLRGSKGYLFLPDDMENLNVYAFERRLASIIMKYDRYLAKAAKSQGLVRFSSHDFRRCFSDMLYKKNANVYMIMKALRHSDIKTTLLYLPSYQEDVLNMIREHQEDLI